jgi:hypothetical protein
MKRFENQLFNRDNQYKDINERVEESKDKFYFMLHGLNGFTR